MGSFYSEHTAEFVLISKLKEILDKKYNTVIPIYYWKSREGNNLSKSIHQYENKLKLLVLFPRRLKDNGFKINSNVVNLVNLFEKYNINTIFGLPLAKNIFDFYDSTIHWFILNNKIEMDLYNQEDIVNLTESMIIKLIEETEYSSFENIINIINKVKSENRSQNNLPWFAGNGVYNPIYFLIR